VTLVVAEAILVSGSHHRAQALKRAIEDAGWQLRVHLDPQRALRDLREQPYSALFCDEPLRGATLGGFLTWHTRLNPGAPFYAIASLGDALATPPRGQPTLVLRYPLDADDVPPPPGHAAQQAVAERASVPLEGRTSTIALADVIEFLCLNAGSSVVRTPLGSIHLADGRIEHASVVASEDRESLVGLKALAELLVAEDLEFAVVAHRPPPQRSVNLPAMLALTEAARQRDESVRNRRLLAALGEAHPQATGVAVGYHVNASPHEAVGDGAAAHRLARHVFDATSGANALGKPIRLALEGEEGALALVVLRNGLFLSGITARDKSSSLLAAMLASLRAQEADSA
jgi:hypothetical protein